MVSSLPNRTSISFFFFFCLTQSLLPLAIAAFSALGRIFLNCYSSFRTLPNTFLFHQFRSFPHFSTKTSPSTLASPVLLQVAWTFPHNPDLTNTSPRKEILSFEKVIPNLRTQYVVDNDPMSRITDDELSNLEIVRTNY